MSFLSWWGSSPLLSTHFLLEKLQTLGAVQAVERWSSSPLHVSFTLIHESEK